VRRCRRDRACRWFSFSGPEAIWNEVRSVCPGGAGMSYRRLDQGGLQWPCPTEEHPGTAILHGDRFASRSRAALRCVEWRASTELSRMTFPTLLNMGRLLYQFNAGTMTMRTDNVNWRPTDTLDLSSEDARRLSITTGDHVRIVSRHGATELPARVSETVRPGEAFATFHSSGVFLNRVTGPERDNVTSTPQYKVTAIRVEKLWRQVRANWPVSYLLWAFRRADAMTCTHSKRSSGVSRTSYPPRFTSSAASALSCRESRTRFGVFSIAMRSARRSRQSPSGKWASDTTIGLWHLAR
jgi:predicted molibdopterin-dependent oxidoreductase YjgC